MAVCLLALASAGGVGCGGTSNSGPGESGGSNGQTISVAQVYKAVANPFFTPVQEGADARAKQLGIDTSTKNPRLTPGGDVDVPGQISIVQDVITRRPDAMLIAPVAPDQLRPVLQRAVDRGIKVVLVDTDIPGWPGKTTIVATNNVRSAAAGCKYLAQKLGDRGKVAVLAGTPGVGPEIDRTNGCLQALQGTGVEVVSKISPRGSRERAQALAADVINAHPDIAGFFGSSSEVSLGAYRAVQLAKKQGRLEQPISIVSHDAVPEEIKIMTSPQEGIRYASVAQRPMEMGEKAMQAAYDALKGKPVPAKIDTGYTLVTSKNAAQFK
jgi:ABC-type sugar transport system substrate-binding protein